MDRHRNFAVNLYVRVSILLVLHDPTGPVDYDHLPHDKCHVQGAPYVGSDHRPV